MTDSEPSVKVADESFENAHFPSKVRRCSKCGERSVLYDSRTQRWWCSNPECGTMAGLQESREDWMTESEQLAFDEYPEPLWNPVKSEVRAAVKKHFKEGDEGMTRLVDPIDADPTKMRVPDFQRETFPDGTGSLLVETKVVPAKLIERPCPCCGGKGTVKVKVPAEVI